MKKLILALVILIIIGIGGYFLFKKGYQTPASSPAFQPNQQNQEQSAKENKISIKNFAFAPATSIIKVGEKITWTNDDSAPHQIESATFNSNQLSKGQSFSFTFNDVGTFDYLCAIHPSMLGKIIVE